jgi:hypothetical protein
VPRYDSSLNDVALEDGDVGFVGLNSRLPRWQLSPGMLSLSENGRIDGSWVPRKGADVITEGSLALGTPLRVPFWMIDTSGGMTVSAASRVGELVTLTVTGHGLPVGGDSASLVVNPSGANNSILYTAVASGDGGDGISIEYAAPASGVAATVVSVVVGAILVTPGDKARMTVSGSSAGILDGDYLYAGIVTSNVSYTSDGSLTPAPVGNWYQISGSNSGVGSNWRIFRWIDGVQDFGEALNSATNQYDFPDSVPWSTSTVTGGVTSADQVISSVNADAVASALVTASASGTVTGSVAEIGPLFLQGGSSVSAYLGLELVTGTPTVDPNGVWDMTPTNANTLTFSIDGATGSETYTVSSPAKVLSRIDDNASSAVLGSCLFSDPASNNAEYIFLAFGNGVSRVKLSSGAVDNYGLPGATTLDGQIDMIQAMDRVFLFREGLVGLQWETGDTDFSEVADGTVTQPQVFEVTGTFVDVVDGKCTITGLTNNTVAVGDTIKIYATTNSNFTEFVGDAFVAFEASGTSFSFYVSVKNISTISTDTLSLGKRVSLGGGFIHQPAFPWAIYFQRRIWGPYWFLDNGSGTFTDRNIRDELVASDILDPNIYDPIQNQFRITDGVADYIVALHPYFDDTLLVFNRNSIHAISGTIGSLADCSVKELTREIGCLARRSIVTQGNNVFFLSDNGVYGLDFFNDYNPRGVGKPLSEPIQPYIDRISQSLAGDAIGIYFNNRYWLAVPLDSSPREGDAIGNNAIFVYNMLNQQWESVDTFGDPNFMIENLIVGTAESRNDLYAITANGGIHVLDKMDEDYDNIATSIATGATRYPIHAAMETRAMLCQTLERKRFTRVGVQALAGSAQSDFGISFNSEDPDSNGSETLASDTMIGPLDANESADVRVRIGGIRGFNGSVAIRREIGRPEIRGVKLMATAANRATLTQR